MIIYTVDYKKISTTFMKVVRKVNKRQLRTPTKWKHLPTIHADQNNKINTTTERTERWTRKDGHGKMDNCGTSVI